MGMTKASMDAQTKRAGTPGFAPLGGAVVASAVMGDGDSDDPGNAGTQSPASLPIAQDAKQNDASTNDGGMKQAPVTGWMNSGKVVATFDGKDSSAKPTVGGLDPNSSNVVAIKP